MAKVSFIPPVVKERRGAADGNQNHPLDLRGWWRRSHIPTRGEKACGGFSSSPGSARDSRKPPQTYR